MRVSSGVALVQSSLLGASADASARIGCLLDLLEQGVVAGGDSDQASGTKTYLPHKCERCIAKVRVVTV